jgi:chromatin remodeling complex protein RSC6
MAKKRPSTKKSPEKSKAPPRAAKPRMVDDQLQQPSDKLAAIIGSDARISFRRANRKVWLYVQRKGFRSTEKRYMIEIKEKQGNQPLTNLLGKTSLSMFEMSRILRGELT